LISQSADRLRLTRSCASIEGWPLLHDESQITWREWFARSGLPKANPIRGANFSDHALMIDSAAAGHGPCSYRLPRTALVALLADGIRSGRVSLSFWLRTHLTEIRQAGAT
jgi:hypothetical protein